MYAIWIARNNARFKNVKPNLFSTLSWISANVSLSGNQTKNLSHYKKYYFFQQFFLLKVVISRWHSFANDLLFWGRTFLDSFLVNLLLLLAFSGFRGVYIYRVEESVFLSHYSMT
jgi:hypothetical protein